MKLYNHSSEASDAPPGGAWVIGNLDGVHRGHRSLLDTARALGPLCVMSFLPHPTSVLAPQFAPDLLMTRDEKIEALQAAGAHALLLQTFDADFAHTSPEAFVDDVLVRDLRPAHVIVGEDFSFGHKGRGNVDLLRERLAPSGAALHLPATVKEGGLVVSSSQIRRLLHQGHARAAAQLLGRRYEVSGRVVRGDGRGRTIGIPTANIETPQKLIPKLGVYATYARSNDDAWAPAVTNIGLRPTFGGEGVRIETHILDGAPDLYERTLHVAFAAWVRGEQKFPSADALVAQVHQDIDAARRFFSEDAAPPHAAAGQGLAP